VARLAIDEAAWTNAWRSRSAAEKSVLALGLLAVAVTATRPAIVLAVLVVAVVAALAGARVPARTYLKAVAAPALFVAISAVSVAITIGSGSGRGALWSWGPVAVTDETLARAIEVTGRSMAAMAALMLLATTTPVSDLLTGLRRLRVPEAIIDIAALIYRMLFTLLDTVGSIREAQTARLGYATGRSARRSIGSLGAAVLTQAWSRARRLEDGLAGRGYTTSLRTLAVHRPVSVPFVAASGALVVALACWSVGWR